MAGPLTFKSKMHILPKDEIEAEQSVATLVGMARRN